jgi:hypothetical protein
LRWERTHFLLKAVFIRLRKIHSSHTYICNCLFVCYILMLLTFECSNCRLLNDSSSTELTNVIIFEPSQLMIYMSISVITTTHLNIWVVTFKYPSLCLAPPSHPCKTKWGKVRQELELSHFSSHLGNIYSPAQDLIFTQISWTCDNMTIYMSISRMDYDNT